MHHRSDRSRGRDGQPGADKERGGGALVSLLDCNWWSSDGYSVTRQGSHRLSETKFEDFSRTKIWFFKDLDVLYIKTFLQSGYKKLKTEMTATSVQQENISTHTQFKHITYVIIAQMLSAVFDNEQSKNT